ncbi:phosphoglycerate kinase, partial [bacterium (Candidatus Gribaldobacteria) CG08_land_8_20_14_0_20_39_15]
EGNDENFAKTLSELGDIYINDAFSVCHRSHASVVGIPKYLPSAAGFLLEKEVKVLSQIIENPKRPLVVIIGGSKVKDKAKVVENFSKIGDWVLLGNLIAEEIKEREIKIGSPEKVISPILNAKMPDLDERTIENFREKISQARMIFWAGPLGKIEEKEYQKGTREIAKAIIKSGAFSAVGGGDTIEFINKIGLTEKFNHVSIGGGAMLAFLAGETLPGLMALNFYGRN